MLNCPQTFCQGACIGSNQYWSLFLNQQGSSYKYRLLYSTLLFQQCKIKMFYGQYFCSHLFHTLKEMHFKYWADGARVVWNLEWSLIIKPCDNAATGTTAIKHSLSLCFSILLSFAFSTCQGQREAKREGIVKLEQDGNKEDGYSGPTFTHTSLGLNYTCVSGGSVQMWRESHSFSNPRGWRAGRHQGGLGGNAFTWDQHTLHAWRMWDAPACSHPHVYTHTCTRVHRHTQLSQDQSDIQWWWEAICRCVQLGACLAGEARKAMALFSCKKLKKPPLCTVMEMRGAGRGEMEAE